MTRRRGDFSRSEQSEGHGRFSEELHVGDAMRAGVAAASPKATPPASSGWPTSRPTLSRRSVPVTGHMAPRDRSFAPLAGRVRDLPAG
jgi:hypothetical protein